MQHATNITADFHSETLRHLTAGQRNNNLSKHERLAAFAGVNIMSHHEFGPIKNGGFYGASEVFARSASSEYAKFMAGRHLRAARYHRADGNRIEAVKSLFDAAYFRGNAAIRPSAARMLGAA